MKSLSISSAVLYAVNVTAVSRLKDHVELMLHYMTQSEGTFGERT